jgi:hypothetical protein
MRAPVRSLRARLAALFSSGVTLLVFAVGTAAPASADPTTDCSGAKAQVVDVTRSLRNAADFGADGHVWALDNYFEHMQLWRVGQHQYCLRLDDRGTFTSFAGVSPNLTGTVGAGVTGTWHGTILAYLTGDFAPVAAVSGDLGEFDERCHQDGTCTWPLWASDLYFSKGYQHVRYAQFGATFDGGAHGTWIQDLRANSGDITG